MKKRADAAALEREAEDANQRFKEHLGAGVGLGLISAGAAAIGVVCPLCVVAVPALVGSGLYQRYRQRCSEQELDDLSVMCEPLPTDPRDGSV